MKTQEEKNRYQREYRQLNNNECTKRYEKTEKGFLMRLYRNMKSRVCGIQKKKYHLYIDKELSFTKEEFYDWAMRSDVFARLFKAYVEASYSQKLAPSVDRLDSSKGYSFDNIEWVTHSVNSSRGAIQRHKNENIAA